MSIDWDAPPPAYETLQQSEETAQNPGRIQTATHVEPSIPNGESAEVVRLRNFLSYCLTIDYRCPGSYKLSSEDRQHYLDLNKVSLARPTSQGLYAEDRVLAPYLRKHLYIPSYQLGIPTSCAERVLNRFAESQSRFFSRYEGCVLDIRQKCGMMVLAEKLWTDRQTLIPRLGVTEPTRLALNQALLRTAQLYFISIDGTDGSRSRHVEGARFRYILNQHGQYCNDNRHVKLTLRQRGYRFVVRGIARLLRLNSHRRSRLPIFPESSE